MRLAVLASLFAASSAAAFVGDGDFNIGDSIRGLPKTIRSSLSQFKQGSGKMWQNGKAASAVRKRIAQQQPQPADSADAVSYAELLLLRKAGEDTQKLIQAGAIWIFVPELFPALLYFFPRALPSTFESDAGKAKRHGTLARGRTRSAIDLLATLEEQAAGTGKKALSAAAQSEVADAFLRAKAPNKALAYLQTSSMPPAEGEKGQKELSNLQEREAKRSARPNAKLRVGTKTGTGKLALLGIPQPILKAGCKLIGVSGPLPGPLRRGSLGKHLEQLVEEDAVLLKVGVGGLTRDELTEACLDRGCGSDSMSDAQLRGRLESWLSLMRSRQDGGYEPHRLRLAAMAACAAAATRDERESLSALPRLLYS